jgi:hypothetical protein
MVTALNVKRPTQKLSKYLNSHILYIQQEAYYKFKHLISIFLRLQIFSKAKKHSLKFLMYYVVSRCIMLYCIRSLIFIKETNIFNDH